MCNVSTYVRPEQRYLQPGMHTCGGPLHHTLLLHNPHHLPTILVLCRAGMAWTMKEQLPLHLPAGEHSLYLLYRNVQT